MADRGIAQMRSREPLEKSPVNIVPQRSFPVPGMTAVEIRVRGRVQGVGFRPTVWRIATELGLAGEVLNDAEGVLIRVRGGAAEIDEFVARIRQEPPPLAAIGAVETREFSGDLPATFRIVESIGGAARTQVSPDAAICPACVADALDPLGRRYRYPFTNCTHCGPRLSIVEGIPYDRTTTTMAAFALCDACLEEYREPRDRRFHAEAIACPTCGPQATLLRLDGEAVSFGERFGAGRCRCCRDPDPARARSSRSRGSAAISSYATRRIPTPSPGCVWRSGATRNPSP